MTDGHFEDKVGHKAEELLGKAKEVVGSLIGDEHREGEGQAERRRVEPGRLGDDARDTSTDVTDRARGRADGARTDRKD